MSINLAPSASTVRPRNPRSPGDSAALPQGLRAAPRATKGLYIASALVLPVVLAISYTRTTR
jgi:hypothetical protein